MYSEFATTLVQQGVLAQARKYSQKKKAIQQGTWVEPVKQPKETTEIEQVLEEVPVDKAINKAIKLLTENGYRVSKTCPYI